MIDKELFDETAHVLKRLVELKQHKDENGKDQYYKTWQPITWEVAKSVIKKIYGDDR